MSTRHEHEDRTVPPGAVLVGVDASEASYRALDWAAEEALRERRPLAVLHGVEVIVPTWPGAAAVDLEQAERLMVADGVRVLREAAQHVRETRPEVEVHELLRRQDPREALLEAGEGAHLLVVGARGRGPVRRLLLGAVGHAVLRHAPCPLVVVRPPSGSGPGSGVLVGADSTLDSGPVLEAGFRTASLLGEPLEVLHCFWDVAAAYGGPGTVAVDDASGEDERRHLAEATAGLREKYPDVEVTSRLARGMAGPTLLASSRGRRMVVVGTRHRNRAAAFVYGSASWTLAERADCPVLVVPVG